MKSIIQNNDILDDISHDVKQKFGFTFNNVTPIKKGWLNLKWKVETDFDTLLIKQYNKQRLEKYSIHELRKVFTLQNNLQNIGFPCPKILSHQDQTFFQTKNGERFIIMEYCPGSNIKPGKLSIDQMHQLGYYTGKLHKLLCGESLSSRHTPVSVPPKKEERTIYWKGVYKEIEKIGKDELLPVIEKQLQIMDIVDFQVWKAGPIGIAHRDLWVDNILFSSNQLSAILDYDRMKYDYLSLDIGRTVISGALDEKGLQTEKVDAFVQGYRVFQEIGPRFIGNSLKLLWYLESEWWLDSEMDLREGPPKRFVEEMIWLSNHLLKIDDILGGM